MTNSELKNKLIKTLDYLRSELSQVRTGRANPSLLEDLQINAYESKMLLKELGSITLSDSHTIMITPWDNSLLSSISKAIRESEHHLNPVEVGNTLKVPIPPLTEERRKDLVKLVSQKVEESKQSIRNIRQDAMKDIDKDYDSKQISEDEKFSSRESVEKIVKDHVEQADTMGDEKSKELMTI